MGKYVVKKTGTGVKFDLKAGNGEIIANSEIYSTKAACLNGIKSVKTNAPVAAVEDQTVEGRRIPLPSQGKERRDHCNGRRIQG